MKLSIVIPTFNRLEILRLTHAALLRTSASAEEYEVVVVDDGGSDGAARWAEHQPHTRSVLRHKTEGVVNPGFARNVGLRMAQGEWVAFMDDDVLHWHDVIAATLDIVAGVNWYSCRGAFLEERDIHYQQGRQIECKESGRMPVHYWWCAPREVLTEIGGFDERLTDYGSEDIDLWDRLWRKGVKQEFIEGQFAVGLYAPRLVPTGVLSREGNKRQREMVCADQSIVRNVGVEWGKA